MDEIREKIAQSMSRHGVLNNALYQEILSLLPKPLDLSKLKVLGESEILKYNIRGTSSMDWRGLLQAQYDSMVSEIKRQGG